MFDMHWVLMVYSLTTITLPLLGLYVLRRYVKVDVSERAHKIVEPLSTHPEYIEVIEKRDKYSQWTVVAIVLAFTGWLGWIAFSYVAVAAMFGSVSASLYILHPESLMVWTVIFGLGYAFGFDLVVKGENSFYAAWKPLRMIAPLVIIMLAVGNALLTVDFGGLQSEFLHLPVILESALFLGLVVGVYTTRLRYHEVLRNRSEYLRHLEQLHAASVRHGSYITRR